MRGKKKGRGGGRESERERWLGEKMGGRERENERELRGKLLLR